MGSRMRMNDGSGYLRAAALLLLLCSGGMALAQKASEQSGDCANAGSNPEMVACHVLEMTAADAALDATYKTALDEIKKASHLNANQRRDWQRALRESQRNWLAYREKDCGEVTGWEWYQGTGMRVASLVCKAVKTRARTLELAARYGQSK